MKKLLAALLLASAPAFAQSANVSTNPMAYSGGSQALSQTPSGGLRVQPMDGAGHDVSASNPLPTTATFGTSALVGVKGLDGSTITGPFNPLPVLIAPSATQGVSTQSCTVACASSIVTGGHGLYGLSFSSTVAGWLLVYDTTTCSANGTVTPKKAFAYTVPNVTVGVSWNNAPMIDLVGTAACFSTTGPYTATASTTAYISLDYK